MTHRQMRSLAITHLQTTEKITRSYPIGLEGFQNDSERVFGNVEFVCKKYHICMLSTNINQYLAFQLPQWTWWVYEWGAQVRKHKYEKAPTQQSHYPAKITQLSHRIPLHLRKILFQVPEIQFLYELQRPSRPKDRHRLQFTHECNKVMTLTAP
jgi:hypothetical protein